MFNMEDPMPVDANDFKACLGRFGSGVTVVTIAGDEDHGMTASAFCSLSLDPPLVLVCVKNGNTTHGKLLESKGFAINILAADQKDLSNRFGGWGFPEDQDKWADLNITRGEASGAPLLDGAMAHLDCTLYGTREGGDHTIFIGHVETATAFGERDELDPLVYFAGAYRGVGKTL
ncbi:MAG: flavin oxidoreductase [Deltaproteobacteria bacterium]|nr:flavin oxidoreductase [Deltaproteobacteria bacterium]